MSTIAEELQKLSPSALVELFVLDATVMGGGVSRFHAGTNALTQPVVWQGETYTPYPIEASGFEKSGKGAAPRPTVRVANIGGAIGAMCAATDDLVDAKVTRKRTFQRFLDVVNFPDAFYPAGHAVAFSRASTATYFDSAGVMRYAGVNEPRIDHDPITGAPRGLLIEEARTNLLTRSSEFDNAAWASAAGTTSTRVNSAGDRGFGLGLITATSVYGGIRQSIGGLTPGTVYSLSFYLESATTLVRLRLENGGATYGTLCDVFINPTTGGLSSKVGFTSIASTVLGSGRVYECVLPAAGGTLTANIELTIATNGHSILLGRPQLEAGVSATSYIPTTTAAVTRAADVATLTGTAFSDWYRQDEGTFVTQHRSGGDLSNTRVWRVSDGPGNTNLLQIAGASSGGVGPYFEGYAGGVMQFSLTDGNETTNTSHLTAAAYRVNDFASSRDGRTVVVDTAGTLPTVNRMFLGYDGTTNYLNGHIARLTYYAERLSDADLQTLSGGGTVSASPVMSVDFTTGSLALSTWAPYNPEADPNAHLTDEIFFVNRKVSENAVFVEFELVSALDVQGKKLPGRTVIQNICTWRYRSSECGYAGGAVADKNDAATADTNLDQCGKRLASCKLRFGAYAELPYGGFPGAGLQRG